MTKVRKRPSSIHRHSGETRPRILYPAKIHFKSKGKIKRTPSDTQTEMTSGTPTLLRCRGGPQAEGDKSVQEGGSALRINCTVNGKVTSKKCSVFVISTKEKLAA